MLPYIAGVIILPIIMGISIASPFDEPLTHEEIYTDEPENLNTPPTDVFAKPEQEGRNLFVFFLAIFWMMFLYQMLRKISQIKAKQKRLD